MQINLWKLLKKLWEYDGFNFGANLGQFKAEPKKNGEGIGAGIEEHIHFHIVPRWTGERSYKLYACYCKYKSNGQCSSSSSRSFSHYEKMPKELEQKVIQNRIDMEVMGSLAYGLIRTPKED